MFKLRDFKHGSKYKKLLENPNYEKIVNRLTGGERTEMGKAATDQRRIYGSCNQKK